MENKSHSRAKENKKHALVSIINDQFKSKGSRFEKRLHTSLKKNNQRSSQIIESLPSLSFLFENPTALNLLPKHFLSLPVFKDYHVCQIFVLEKGKTFCTVFYADLIHNLDHYTVPTQDFNQLFVQIKKSKSKIFNQSLMKKESLEVLGHFLGKELEFKTHFVIFVLGKNSFIPPSQEEQDFFSEISLSLFPIIEKTISNEAQKEKGLLSLSALEQFPLPLKLQNSEGEILWSNDHNNTSLESRLISLEGDKKLVLPKEEFDEDSGELHHYQRISLLGELLNTLQHELSNPLFGIKLTADLLSTETQDLESLETLKEISSNAQRCQMIIDDFSKIYSSGLTQTVEVGIYKLVTETIKLTKSETKEIKKEIHCHGFNAADDFILSINPTLLSQIVFNLILNSAQAIKTSMNVLEGKIQVNIFKSEHLLEIQIIDNGPGIDSAISHKIFEPFFTTKSNGTGLGLAICQTLAKNVGGTLTFSHNAPLPGVSFSIKLPLM